MPLHGRRVLVVDDDPAIRALLTDLFTEAGAEVLALPCGRQVVGTVQAWHPSVVVLDLMMQPVDGFAVLEALRASGLVPALPVIVLTAMLPAAEAHRMQALGARAVIAKPLLDWPTLLSLVMVPPPPYSGGLHDG